MLALSIGILEEVHAAGKNKEISTILLDSRLFQVPEVVLSNCTLRRNAIRWLASVGDNEVVMQLYLL